MNFVLDINEVPTSVADFPNGFYPAQITGYDVGTAQTGTPYLELLLDVHSDNHGTASMKTKLYMTQKASGATFKFLRAVMQMTKEELVAEFGNNVEINPPEYVGADLIIELADEYYEDSKTGERKRIKRVPFGGFYPSTDVHLLVK